MTSRRNIARLDYVDRRTITVSENKRVPCKAFFQVHGDVKSTELRDAIAESSMIDYISIGASDVARSDR
jgi:hypothetical protein